MGARINEEYQYLDILARLLKKLESADKRRLQHGPQGVPSVTLGLTTMTFDLSKGKIPLLTTRKTSFRNVVLELLWFLTGDSQLDFLHQHGVHFWDQWATTETGAPYGLQEGDVGRIYGPNWIRWPTVSGEPSFINQIAWLIDGIKEHPEWRRWKVTAWNPEFIDKAFLAPCHGDFHILLVDGKLELHHFQRSGDWIPGIPFNIASYSILLRMIAHVTGLPAGKLVQVTSDSHMYATHLEVAKMQLTRTPYPFPKLILDPKGEVKDIFEFRWPEHFLLEDYSAHPHIPVDVAT